MSKRHLAPTETLYREHLLNGHRLRFRATGGSMVPCIRSGDIVHVVPIDRVRVGDILLYVRQDRWFVHRLMRQEGAAQDQGVTLILRGDALRHPDPRVPVDAILGRVVQIERGSRRIRADGLRGFCYTMLTYVPILRYPLIPWAYACLSRAKRRLLRSG